MGGSYWLRLGMMIIGLVLVLVMMSNLNKKGLSGGIAAMLGLTDAGPKIERLSWCETRVQALKRADGHALVQEGMKWFAQNGEKHELNFVAVEKWFGRNCTVSVEPIQKNAMDSEAGEVADVMTVQFIKGPEVVLRKIGDDLFMWRDMAFRSSEMRRALDELQEFLPAN